ncbi:MAG: hypothetical protein HOP33_11940 [Verrucomicrobia bacterium]|nr:hypothetical protein [Verrucomicrobiota bacterium]
MKLPNGERAELGTKLEEYSLNAAHRQGQHKARVFESVLGITVANKEILQRAILDAATHSNEAVAIGDNGFGLTFSLRFSITTPNGSATVLTAWIVRYNEDFPRLTTCFIVQA